MIIEFRAPAFRILKGLSMKHPFICSAVCLMTVLISASVFAQWTPKKGLSGERIQCLASWGSTIYAGTWGEGVFRFSPSDTAWTAIDSELTNLYIRSLLISGTHLFAGTDNGVYQSPDSGKVWAAASAGLTNMYVYSLAANDSNLFAGTNGGVFRSTNNGLQWVAIDSGLTDNDILSLAVDDSVVYAGTWGGGIFRSINNGRLWAPLDSGLTNRYVYALAIQDSIVFAGTNGGGIFACTVQGTVWSGMDYGLTSTYFWTFAVSGKKMFTATSGGVFISMNYGKSWSLVNSGLTDLGIMSLAVCDTNLYAGTDVEGVWQSPLSQLVAGVPGGQEVLPLSYELRQNYPNPFNPATRISYTVTVAGHVGIGVYDLLGREISRLVDANKEPGEYSVEWNADGWPSGVYFYRMDVISDGGRGGRFSAARKMVLIR